MMKSSSSCLFLLQTVLLSVYTCRLRWHRRPLYKMTFKNATGNKNGSLPVISYDMVGGCRIKLFANIQQTRPKWFNIQVMDSFHGPMFSFKTGKSTQDFHCGQRHIQVQFISNICIRELLLLFKENFQPNSKNKAHTTQREQITLLSQTIKHDFCLFALFIFLHAWCVV